MLMGIISRKSWSDFQVLASLGVLVGGVRLKKEIKVLYSNPELGDLYLRRSQNFVYLLKTENTYLA